jgi:O-antigen/teichoic acid export membrane protein
MLTPRSLLGQATWAFNGQVGQTVLGFASIVVMGRILGPEAYGVFTMALLIAGLAEIFVAGHMTDFLVQKADAGPADNNAAFLLVAAISLTAAVGLIAAAPIAAVVVGTPEVEAMMPAVGLLIVLTACGTIPVNLLVRTMRFDLLARVDTGAAAVAFVTGTCLALSGAGVWSLLLMEITRRSLRGLLAAWAASWRPGLSTSRAHVGELWVFARARLLGGIFQYVAAATPRYVIGTMLGTEAVGYYAVANRIVEQMSGLITGPLSAVAFPATVQSRSDPATIRILLEKAIAISTAATWPAILGLVVVAPIVVPLALGPQWIGAIPVFQILILMALRAPSSGFNAAVVLGMGRALALVLLCVITWPVGAGYVSNLIGMAVPTQIRIATVNAVPAMLMAVATEALRRWIGPEFEPVTAAILLVSYGMTTYLLIWGIYRFKLVRHYALGMWRRVRRSNGNAVRGV